MTDHGRFFDLAAMSIDFDLSTAERAELDAHLLGCASCRDVAERYRGDALALMTLPVIHMAPHRAVVVLDRIVGHRRSALPRVRLLLVAALLALLAASIALTVGAELLRRQREQQLSVVVEPPAVEVPLNASPLPSTSTAPTEVYAAEAGGTLPATHYRPSSVAFGPAGEMVVVGGNACVVSSDTGRPSCVGRISQADSIDAASFAPVKASRALDLGGAFPVSGPELGIERVAGSDDGFVAIGYADDGGFGVTIWRQEPGKGWERLARDRVFKDARVRTLAAIDGGWIIGGEIFGSGAPRAALWTSADGRSWQRAKDGPVFDVGGYAETGEEPAAGGIIDVATAGPRVVLVGSTRDANGEGSRGAAWVSDDGHSWRRANMPDLDGRLVAVARLGPGFIAFMSDYVPASTDAILVSDDGATWRKITPEGIPGGMEMVAAGPLGSGVALALTRDARLEIVASSDGTHWTNVDSVAFEGTPGVTAPEGSVRISAVDMAEGPQGTAAVIGWVDMTSDGSSRTFLYRVSASPSA